MAYFYYYLPGNTLKPKDKAKKKCTLVKEASIQEQFGELFLFLNLHLCAHVTLQAIFQALEAVLKYIPID